MKQSYRLLALSLIAFALAAPAFAADKIKVLIIDGQNNHDWKTTTPIMKWILEDSGRFTVDISTTPASEPQAPKAPKGTVTPEQKAKHDADVATWKKQKAAAEKELDEQWKTWHPKFSDYDVILSNYNGKLWPEAVRTEFQQYM